MPIKWLLVKRNGSSTFVHDNLVGHKMKFRIGAAEQQFPTEIGHMSLEDCQKAKSKRPKTFLICKETKVQVGHHASAINCGPFKKIDGVFRVGSNRFEDRVYGHLGSVFRRTYREVSQSFCFRIIDKPRSL